METLDEQGELQRLTQGPWLLFPLGHPFLVW
jgi:hypothetical protein